MPQARSTQSSPCPSALGSETEHYWLVQRMARTTGLNLAAAMEDGRLDQDEWAAMVQRCRGCAWAEGCVDWMDKQFEPVDGAPGTCLNATRMAALAER